MSEIVAKMIPQSAKEFSRENLILFSDSENEIDDSYDKFETQNFYDWQSESDNLDLICQNYILFTFK